MSVSNSTVKVIMILLTYLPQLSISCVFNTCRFYKTLSDRKMQETISQTKVEDTRFEKLKPLILGGILRNRIFKLDSNVIA